LTKQSLDTIIKNDNYKKRQLETKPLEVFSKKVETKKAKAFFFCSYFRHNRKQVKIVSIILLIFISLLIIFFQPVKNIYTLLTLAKDGKYLILFQNNAELRGGGGFLGSFAVVDIQDKKIKSYYFEANIYKKDNQFTAINKIPLPPYFQEGFGSQFSLALRDANYPSDFQSASKNVAKLYDLEYQDHVDGVIAINASLMKDLLALTGPIKTKDNVVINKDNFFSTVQNEVEGGYFDNTANQKLNEPKSILKDMVPTVLAKIKKENPITTYKFFINEMKTKNILFWFDDNREAKVIKRNWSGTIPGNNNELIYVSDNNIGGQKTSLNISRSISLSIPDKTSLNRNLTIKRTYEINPNYQNDIDNKNYTKVFLPYGSTIKNISQDNYLLSLKDYSLSIEEGKTVVGLWTTISPGQSTSVSINFSLPLNIKLGMINYIKQPGITKEKLQISIMGKNIFNQQLDQDRTISY
jgi:hypothetical protein